MADPRTAALSYAHQNSQVFLDYLKDLVRIPSVSTSSDHAKAMKDAAENLANRLRGLGFTNVALHPTGGHPVV